MLPLVALAAAALAFAPANHATHQHVYRHGAPRAHVTGTLELGLLREINQTRAQHGLRPLRWSTRLTAAANQHSASMAAKGYFSHASANGSAFWRRIASFYGYRGYREWSVGENLLWSSPDVSPAGAL